MPTYRYRCSGCNGEFEVWQSFQEDPIRAHDDGCGGEVLRVLTPAGIVLKGSGFYKTDSRSSGRERSSSDDTESKSDPSEQGPSSSDSGKDTKSGDGTSTPSTTPEDSSKSTAGAAKPS